MDIYAISASGGPPRRVTTSPSIDATPSWSRDGRWIYFGSRPGRPMAGVEGPVDRGRAGRRPPGHPARRVRADRVDRREVRLLHQEIVGHARSAERHLEDPGRGRGRGGRRRVLPLVVRQLGPDRRRSVLRRPEPPPARECAGSSGSWASVSSTRPRWRASGILPFSAGLLSASRPTAAGCSPRRAGENPI